MQVLSAKTLMTQETVRVDDRYYNFGLSCMRN